jgi:hypothetical protein
MLLLWFLPCWSELQLWQVITIMMPVYTFEVTNFRV